VTRGCQRTPARHRLILAERRGCARNDPRCFRVLVGADHASRAAAIDGTHFPFPFPFPLARDGGAQRGGRPLKDRTDPQLVKLVRRWRRLAMIGAKCLQTSRFPLPETGALGLATRPHFRTFVPRVCREWAQPGMSLDEKCWPASRRSQRESGRPAVSPSAKPSTPESPRSVGGHRTLRDTRRSRSPSVSTQSHLRMRGVEPPLEDFRDPTRLSVMPAKSQFSSSAIVRE
jgi:hypothetical protein